jgi:diaphanous 1
MVMAAMSDYRIVFEESFRFEGLISSLRLPEADPNDFTGSGAHSSEDDGAWDARTSSMVLINALTNGPESLEERILLREEFSRRGLNEVIVVSVNCLSQFHCPLTVRQTLRYIRPPEGLITQLDVYTEEKFEDEEDMRERASHLFHAGDRHNGSEMSSILDELITVTGAHTEDYYNVISIIRIMISFFQRLDERYGSRINCDIFDDRAFQPFKNKVILHYRNFCRTS